MSYTLAIGTHDPHSLAADNPAAAITEAIGLVTERYGAVLQSQPDEAVTLLGPEGLLTRPSERLDEFVRRRPDGLAAMRTDTLAPGDAPAPDCNGD